MDLRTAPLAPPAASLAASSTGAPAASLAAAPDDSLEYDGSYSGWLCTMAELLNLRFHAGLPEERLPGVCRPGQQTDLFGSRVPVDNDPDRAERCYQRLLARLGSDCLERLQQAWASDLGAANGLSLDSALARVLRLAWAEGATALQRLDAPAVIVVQKAITRSCRELNLFKGISRFAELVDGSLYADIQPACDVIGWLAEHFAARFPGQRWILHDSGRGRACLHQPGQALAFLEGFSVNPQDLRHSAGELVIQELWRQYFDTITIAERANPRCQRSFLPLKHRYNLPEFNAVKGGQAD
ncbi:MAG: hypothetical protein A2087_06585 [Spirochaetes bacterium GWD1_61_31]|nr:MAG: hypothetical protein A2Y37_08885 [Spirochaetes bacterium GWB1_60_80]OHD31886.1 MAG: hypothetical protein A2004_10270 [Spirochaetes bacterium GWC1_61_12]OHD40017.1 MAG: hypothetical protein A2087_06585 [Spirochaetes bacterium GWD1_61_31]OHD42329.1 MAG: hypothetical protein A2Y35_11415 [Spirochaetes bacterium GWE1_60_18]OHD58479.1 MAG: hypothetical protein A2Y32_06920 [Spirochaetes bacterium GWF1_60_12]HAW85471.1 hypothetical protein [Spirochaetaceae bacterium]